MKFALPTIAMSLFMSFYTMVDGFFVANLIGTDALSAINLTSPVISLVTAVSTMLATGGSAVIMMKMGEGKEKQAREDFTALILVNVLVGIVMWAAGYACMDWMFSKMNLSRVLQRIFKPLSFVYSTDFVNDQLRHIPDCLRKIIPLIFVLRRRRNYQYCTGLCVY